MSQDKLPFFKSWNILYGLVIGVLLLLMVLFYLFTKYFE